jgi:hypothetical protein
VEKYLLMGRWLALGLSMVGGANDAAATPAAGSARSCLSFRREQADKSLRYHARNACQRLECRMTYRLSCQDPDGKQTSASDEVYGFDVGARETKTVTLSAEACEHGWTISDVDWDCT